MPQLETGKINCVRLLRCGRLPPGALPSGKGPASGSVVRNLPSFRSTFQTATHFHSSRPAIAGRGDPRERDSAVGRGASATLSAPSTMLAALARFPSPVCTGEDESRRSRDAFASELCSQRHQKSARRRREAERRKAHCPANVRRQVAVCALPLWRAPCHRHAAFRRSRLRHSPPALTPMAQLQNRVSRGGGATGVLPASPKKLAAVKHAPCRPVLLPVDRGPGAARERE